MLSHTLRRGSVLAVRSTHLREAPRTPVRFLSLIRREQSCCSQGPATRSNLCLQTRQQQCPWNAQRQQPLLLHRTSLVTSFRSSNVSLSGSRSFFATPPNNNNCIAGELLSSPTSTLSSPSHRGINAIQQKRYASGRTGGKTKKKKNAAKAPEKRHNELIVNEQLVMVDRNDELMGVFSLKEALEMANKEDADLIEVMDMGRQAREDFNSVQKYGRPKKEKVKEGESSDTATASTADGAADVAGSAEVSAPSAAFGVDNSAGKELGGYQLNVNDSASVCRLRKKLTREELLAEKVKALLEDEEPERVTKSNKEKGSLAQDGAFEKQVRIGAFIEPHDLDVKVRMMRKFLVKGAYVTVHVFFSKHQEMDSELAHEMILRIGEMVRDIGTMKGKLKELGQFKKSMAVLFKPVQDAPSKVSRRMLYQANQHSRLSLEEEEMTATSANSSLEELGGFGKPSKVITKPGTARQTEMTDKEKDKERLRQKKGWKKEAEMKYADEDGVYDRSEDVDVDVEDNVVDIGEEIIDEDSPRLPNEKSE